MSEGAIQTVCTGTVILDSQVKTRRVRCEFVSKSLPYHCVIDLLSLRNRFAITALSLHKNHGIAQNSV
jgi:hypothetical protein